MSVGESPVELHHMKEIVWDTGAHGITVITGHDAFDKDKTYRPDVILMDVVMDGVDGFEAAAHYW